MDKLVRRIVHYIKTYYLSDKNYPMNNLFQTYDPPLVRKRPMTLLLTGLSRVFVCEYFKGTSGC